MAIAEVLGKTIECVTCYTGRRSCRSLRYTSMSATSRPSNGLEFGPRNARYARLSAVSRRSAVNDRMQWYENIYLNDELIRCERMTSRHRRCNEYWSGAITSRFITISHIPTAGVFVASTPRSVASDNRTLKLGLLSSQRLRFPAPFPQMPFPIAITFGIYNLCYKRYVWGNFGDHCRDSFN